MNHLTKIIASVAVLSSLCVNTSDACTNIIVTKGASTDGSCMVSYAADSHALFGELYFHKAADWKAGSPLNVICWDSGEYLGQIPQVAHTYQTVGNMNEHQLIIGETTFGGREELVNENGIVDYGSLIYITLQRAKTAKEAIKVIDNLLQTYGYPSEGETFSIVDKEEAWIMEIVGKGKELGAVWVAIRIPDGYISAHANQSRIDKFPLNDPENCLYSKDVISFARKMGYFKGKDEDFSFCDAYCPADFSGLRGCEARVWSAFRLLGGKNFDSDKYLDFAMGYNASNKMPLYIKPENKVSVKNVADVMRDHYEGTPMDMTVDVGTGDNHLPYRWRPMSFEIDGQEYIMERAIATQQTGFWFVAQSKGWVPDEVGGILWFGVDDAATSPLTPVYTSITTVPESFRVGNGDMLHYSPTSAFWLNNKLTHFAYLMYDRVAPEIRKAVDEYENENIKLVAEKDKEATALVKSGLKDQAVVEVTNFTNARAAYIFDKWQHLENYLLVKYMDGNVKIQNPDGSFKNNGNSDKIPDGPLHPDHSESWLRSIIQEHGDVIRVK